MNKSIYFVVDGNTLLVTETIKLLDLTNTPYQTRLNEHGYRNPLPTPEQLKDAKVYTMHPLPALVEAGVDVTLLVGSATNPILRQIRNIVDPNDTILDSTQRGRFTMLDTYMALGPQMFVDHVGELHELMSHDVLNAEDRGHLTLPMVSACANQLLRILPKCNPEHAVMILWPYDDYQALIRRLRTWTKHIPHVMFLTIKDNAIVSGWGTTMSETEPGVVVNYSLKWDTSKPQPDKLLESLYGIFANEHDNVTFINLLNKLEKDYTPNDIVTGVFRVPFVRQSSLRHGSIDEMTRNISTYQYIDDILVFTARETLNDMTKFDLNNKRVFECYENTTAYLRAAIEEQRGQEQVGRYMIIDHGGDSGIRVSVYGEPSLVHDLHQWLVNQRIRYDKYRIYEQDAVLTFKLPATATTRYVAAYWEHIAA